MKPQQKCYILSLTKVRLHYGYEIAQFLPRNSYLKGGLSQSSFSFFFFFFVVFLGVVWFILIATMYFISLSFFNPQVMQGPCHFPNLRFYSSTNTVVSFKPKIRLQSHLKHAHRTVSNFLRRLFLLTLTSILI